MADFAWGTEPRFGRKKPEWIGSRVASAFTTIKNTEVFDDICIVVDPIINPVKWPIRIEYEYTDEPSPVVVNVEVTPSNYEEARREKMATLEQRLRALRARIVESGVPLLTWDEIEEEVRSLRTRGT